MSIELQVKRHHEIILPDWLGATSLTLAEIGAVVCLACRKNGNEESTERVADEEMAAVMKSLKDKKVLQFSLEGRTLSVEIDLDVVAPEDEKEKTA